LSELTLIAFGFPLPASRFQLDRWSLVTPVSNLRQSPLHVLAAFGLPPV